MLREDHKKVKEIFDEFERAEEGGAKGRLVEKALLELTVHAILEEELFYPAVRREIGNEPILGEAEEEHHVAKLLIGELCAMKPSDSRFDAKFRVLAENVRRHIEKEEGKILPRIEQSDIDLESLGQEMRERKLRLVEEVSLKTIREASSLEPEMTFPGGRRFRRARRGGQSRRMGLRSKAKT